MLDNNYFSFSIHILIFVLANFNCCAYISIFHGLISRLIFVLLSLCVCCFYWTVNMSYFSLSFSLCYFQFFEPRGIIFLTIFLYKITIAILPYTIFYYYYVIKPASFLVGFSLTVTALAGSIIQCDSCAHNLKVVILNIQTRQLIVITIALFQKHLTYVVQFSPARTLKKEIS